MKQRVVQLITFEIELDDDLAEPLAEDVADQICSVAAKHLRLDAGAVIHNTAGTHTGGIRMGVSTVTVAKVSSDELTLILADRRRLHAENRRYRVRTAALESWINAQLRSEADPNMREDGLRVGAELAVTKTRLNDDPEET